MAVVIALLLVKILVSVIATAILIIVTNAIAMYVTLVDVKLVIITKNKQL